MTLTGADIAVSTSDSTKINTALAGKANDANVVHKTGDTMTGNLTINKVDPTIHVMDGPRYLGLKIVNNNKYIETEDYDFQLPSDDGTLALTAGTGHEDEIAILDANGNPVASGYDTSDFLTSVPTSYKTYNDTKTQLGTDGFKTYSATKTQLGTDGFKTYSATKTQLGTDGFKTYADTKTALDSVYKPLQTAKSSPTASGNTTSFIDIISQDANGVITAYKKTITSASTSASGIVQLNDTLTSTSTTLAATANAVKTVNDNLS